MNKKQEKLGMNPSTASGRLVKDLLFDFAIKAGYVCYRCKKPLDRKTFSIEHKVSWLNSDNPVELFFDINNIAYSHLKCNVEAVVRYKSTKPHGTLAKYKNGCRCDDCRVANAMYQKNTYTKEKRQAKYIRQK